MAEAKVAVAVEDGVPDGFVEGREGFGYLPPINRLRLPKTTTQTALVRWLFTLGYKVKEISNGLNIRYQQVRNMVTTQPKRAAREDLPELRIELLDMEDEVDMLLGQELERTHLEARKQSRKKGQGQQVNEADLDDENYQEPGE